MKEVAKLQIKDRMELFQATAISMGMQPNVIEKDFWVCFMLDHLSMIVSTKTLLSLKVEQAFLSHTMLLRGFPRI